MSLGKFYSLNIKLVGSKPKIWRTVCVNGSVTFYKLHHILQIVMRWENYHLFEFKVNDINIVFETEDYSISEGDRNCKKITLGEIISNGIMEFYYKYDFGDSWLHYITIEETSVEEVQNIDTPVVLSGENQCPPEDVGGIKGYYKFLENIFFEDHDNIEYDWREWISEKKISHPEGYMPLSYDIKSVNEELQNLDLYIAEWEQDPFQN